MEFVGVNDTPDFIRGCGAPKYRLLFVTPDFGARNVLSGQIHFWIPL